MRRVSLPQDWSLRCSALIGCSDWGLFDLLKLASRSGVDWAALTRLQEKTGAGLFPSKMTKIRLCWKWQKAVVVTETFEPCFMLCILTLTCAQEVWMRTGRTTSWTQAAEMSLDCGLAEVRSWTLRREQTDLIKDFLVSGHHRSYKQTLDHAEVQDLVSNSNTNPVFGLKETNRKRKQGYIRVCSVFLLLFKFYQLCLKLFHKWRKIFKDLCLPHLSFL